MMWDGGMVGRLVGKWYWECSFYHLSDVGFSVAGDGRSVTNSRCQASMD